MGQNVDANGRSILHKGHGMTHTCAVPDVCKTPTPGGPVPIPYVNIAMDSDITDGADTVKIEGNPVANVGAKISTSTGDEPGSAGGGIISSKIKGTVTWKMGSLDVKAEGKSVVRFLDQDFHNGNSFNTAFIAPGQTGMAYGDDFEGQCPVCGEKPEEHAVKETTSSAARCAKIIEYLQNEFKKIVGDDYGGGDARASRARLAKRNRKERPIVWSGYMVGVMICACETSFAAMSGADVLPGFKDACKHAAIDVVIGSGKKGEPNEPRAVTKEDLIAANTSTAVSSDAAKQKELRAQVKERWGWRHPKSPDPGACAGQHLLARSGHGPKQITEMWFAPSGGKWWRQDYAFWRRDPEKGIERKVKGSFGPDVPKTDKDGPTPWGATVGSCETCQDLLFLTMCPKRECPTK